MIDHVQEDEEPLRTCWKGVGRQGWRRGGRWKRWRRPVRWTRWAFWRRGGRGQGERITTRAKGCHRKVITDQHIIHIANASNTKCCHNSCAYRFFCHVCVCKMRVVMCGFKRTKIWSINKRERENKTMNSIHTDWSNSLHPELREDCEFSRAILQCAMCSCASRGFFIVNKKTFCEMCALCRNHLSSAPLNWMNLAKKAQLHKLKP